MYLEVLESKLSERDYEKLERIANPKVQQFIAESCELCNPERIFICSDSSEDIAYVRQQAVSIGEEKPLAISGHTYHFDGIEDQGRDREVTKYLVPKNDSLNKTLKQIEREEGLTEVKGLLKGAMQGRTMIVRFLSLGPTNSVFSIPCVQCTDSWYVAHSEDLLYRPAYDMFTRKAEQSELFCILHSAGKMDGNMVSVEAEKKRIYIDYTKDTIYSVNTQYAGNTVGLKKLALRLTIRKADKEGWLAEHMLLMGVHGPNGRKTYLAGAFPSACGKTSTAMLPGETIVGDDIAYFRNIDGSAQAVNAEAGIFGIIQNVNPTDDPAIHKVLTTPGEVIFSNILVKDGIPYWLGMDCALPKEGVNFSGSWYEGMLDSGGNKIPPAHKNARYAVVLKALESVDPELDNPQGVALAGIMYGGRDAKSYVPVQQSFDWEHGIIAYGAALETETTFATIGKEGVPEINLMSIQDFVSIPLGKYIRNNLDFGKKLKKTPLVFGVNYFLRDKEGKFLNGVRDKHIWVKWMELRVHNEADAIKSPTGWIPKYDDLRILFKQVLDKDYAKEDYIKQFTIRVPENLAKLERVEKFHRENLADAPQVLFEVLGQQRDRLLQAQKYFGDYISPESLELE
ncbi:MAG: phosphoenolpyruvate carboxykinase (GTP) [Candidatus Omnitrophica bacterium]|nr:phosphoenolpyruvate carboxykinase (GTP) [Candidatus Omnitrophota bacterium]